MKIPCILPLIRDFRRRAVRIRLHHPPSSPSVFGHRRESVEMSACARDVHSCPDPESGSKGSDSPKSANSSLGAIYLGPRIIAFHSMTRATFVLGSLATT
jgi:hypothetical protein